MVKTRSTHGRESEEQVSSCSGTTTTTTTFTTATTQAVMVIDERDEAEPSGIKATPVASSIATVVPRSSPEQMPPPINKKAPTTARSRRSKASSKRLLAELEAKEKLAELELRKIEAEAQLVVIRQERAAAESSPSDSEQEEEEEDLTTRRVTDWFRRGSRQDEEGQPDQKEVRRQLAAGADKVHTQREQKTAQIQHSPLHTDIASLSAALAEAINANKSRKFITDLPTFSGLSCEWLQFKAAYEESAPSFSQNENTTRLRRSLKGAALEAVSALLISQPHPDEVVIALERRYGRPDALLLAETEKLKALARLTDSPRDLCVFASRIANAVATIKVLKKPQYLHNPEVLRTIVEKLTPILRNKWYDYAAFREETPELQRMTEFLNREADKCAPYAPAEHNEQKEKAQPPKKRLERAYAATTEETARKINTTAKKASCPMCNQNHQLPACPLFIKASTNDRWDIAKKNRICYRCLAGSHYRLSCRAKPCGHNGCPMRHHNLLHHEKAPPTDTPPETEPPQQRNEEVVASAVKQVGASVKTCRAYLKIAPIVLRGPRATFDAFAMLDEGSTVTIIDASLAEQLGLDGPTEPMWVQGVGGSEISYKKSKIVNVAIRGRYCNEEVQINNAHTVASLGFTTQTISERELENCAHLEELKHELIYEDARPKILIGQDNWELIVSQEIRRGRRDQLVASKTLLGWVLHGCRTTQAEPVAQCCAHLVRAEPIDRMEKMMHDYFALESLSIEPRKQRSDPEQKALEILEKKSRRLPDGRFETGLLWREEDASIPNNRADALKRLYTLERKLDRDAKLKQQYEERVQNLLTSKYAEPAVLPSSGKTWYLPHFPVINPDKPKPRLVHDAAAKSHGRSLNDMLLPGPDLLQSLPGVIMRFRQYTIAVSSDIKEMFMQIKIREEDRDALRFLWRGNRREGEPEEYRMTSVVFGASSSPCTALYIKNRNAREHATQFPLAARAIERNHYMDDYLQSFAIIKEAKQVTRDVNYVHKQAGFLLRGWASNNSEAIDAITDTIPTGGSKRSDTTVPIGGSEIEKTLGLLWDTKEDCIRFRLNTSKAPPEVLNGARPPTKREALSIIMSIFDPLGLISPITTPAKRILQNTWRYNTGWDEALPEELHEKWSGWLRQLHDLGDLTISRCYDKEPAARYELHTFTDASEEAYAAAVYWRTTRADGSVKVALAAAKSRVTPTKPISVPRLELQAAVLGVRLAKSVADEHDYEITQKTFWSDSRTVLAWIRAEPRSYKTFVAHRLAEIEDSSRKNEWRWLPSADNVADDATRATPMNFNAGHRWYHGPGFLYEPESSWPTENKVKIAATGEEKEKCHALQLRKEHAHLPEIERFSKWTRLLRATGRVLQFIDLCRNKSKQTVAAARRKRTCVNPTQDDAWNKPATRARPPAKQKAAPATARKNNYIALSARYIVAAEQLWMRASQEDSYEKERERIAHNRVPEKDDKLYRLSVYMDKDRLIRLRGRIAAASDLRDETVHPVVLHGKHQYTKLYVSHVHESLHHGGTEIVVNELRQRVHIVKVRPAVKEAIARCARCRLLKAKPATPATGDLPAARLAHHVRPFSFTGLDYFGPLEVTVGRHREKRYVALFTCMTSRAIHLEVAASLSSDSAINALRRFIARRGCPAELWSDNATAFKGAHRELTEAIKDEANARRINWRFLPPSAPFMAGAWERMVRTVKEAMRATLHERFPSEETLLTLLAEVEATVNSRPLTYVAVDPEDPPALTPNMILIGPDCHSPAPGTFNECNITARQHWKRAQQLADSFWRRWVREYMPLLQHRREPYNSGVPPAVGDVVIVCDSNLPRNTWPRGRVTKTYPGKDGVVRVVDVTTSRGHVLRRPTKKIIVLPGLSQGDGGRNVHDEHVRIQSHNKYN